MDLSIFQFPFMQRALIAGIILAALLALLGVFVMLKKMTFFADGIAHASLGGIALGLLLSFNPLIVALLASLVFALIIYLVEKKYQFASDTTIGIIFTGGMSLGLILISFKSGYQPELISFLFGNILSVGLSELWLIGLASVLIYLIVWRYFKAFILLALDSETAEISGYKTHILQPVLYMLLSATVVLGIKILGIILVSGLLIIPVAVARLSAKSFKSFVIRSIIFAELIVLIGLVVSYYLDSPTGPVIVLVGIVIFILQAAWSSLLKRKIIK
ncbi:MAG: metal ABC transporter permease [Candidatus Buchananbacteria bacterium]|nr:metal ABC transporter permease [Candidatus Buchananbacteria bacterium]